MLTDAEKYAQDYISAGLPVPAALQKQIETEKATATTLSPSAIGMARNSASVQASGGATSAPTPPSSTIPVYNPNGPTITPSGEPVTSSTWRPDFTQPNPYEGMPAGYTAKVNEVFKPTVDTPLAPYVGQVIDPESNTYAGVRGELVTINNQADLDAFNKSINNSVSTKVNELLIPQINALKALEPFKVSTPIAGPLLPGQTRQVNTGYDINSYLLSASSPKEAFETLQKAGFTWEDIQKATKENVVIANEARAQIEKQYSKAEIAKVVGTMAADMIIPGYYTARNWDEMGAGEKSLSIALDAMSIIPFTKAAGMGARGVATAGRLERLAGAAKGVGREFGAQVVAPVTMVAHPVATVKGTVGSIRDLGESLIHPHKIPEAVMTTSSGTVRLRVTEATTPKQAIEIRETLMEAVAKGDKPLVEINGTKYELAQSPFMKETKGGLAHATPDIEILENARVKPKEGMPDIEQGWFVANEPPTIFTQKTAFNKLIVPVPVKASGKVADIGKYRPNELVQLDKSPIRPLNLADAKNIPADLSDDLLSYIKREDGVIYGSMNEWVKVKSAAKPNDVDLVFKDAGKAIADIKDIATRAGYKTRNVPHGIEILKDGEWVKLGDIVDETQHSKMLNLPMITNKVDGVKVETLGKQYIGQAYGAVDKSAKASTRATKLEKAANDVRKMIKESGITAKKPGIYVISSETAAKTKSSGKIYKDWENGPVAEMERVLPVGEKIPGAKQKLFTRVGPQRQRVEIYLEKPLSKVSIAKLKAMGLVEDLKAPFKPAITVTGDMAGLDAKGIKALTKELDRSGNRRVADVLRRSQDDILRAGGRTGRGGVRAARSLTSGDRVGGRRVDATRTELARVDTARTDRPRTDVRRVTDRAIDPRRPDARTPDSRRPDNRAPDNRAPDNRTPDPLRPDVRTPEPRTPDPRTPDPRAPDFRTPDPRIPDPRIPDPRIPGGEIEFKGKGQQPNEKAMQVKPGTLVFEQGEFKKGTVYKITEPPYNKTITTVGKPPAGYVDTGDTPASTIQTIGGPAKKNINVPMGVTTAHAKANKKEITFTANPKITYQKGKIKITETNETVKQPRINSKSGRGNNRKPHYRELGAGVVRDRRGQHIKLGG